MKQLADDQIEKVMEDISWIKSIISQNRRVIRLIMLPTHYKWSYLLQCLSLWDAAAFCISFSVGSRQPPEKQLLRQVLNHVRYGSHPVCQAADVQTDRQE